MFGYPLGRFLFRFCYSGLISVVPHLAFAQAAGPPRVPVPPPITKPNVSKPKTDRSTLPPVPVFRDIAKQIGITASHIAAPEAHYVVDSTSGGSGLFDCHDDRRADIHLINVSHLARLHSNGGP